MKLINVNEVAEMVGVGVSTIWYWINKEKFPCGIKLTARTTRWKVSDIENWLEEREAAA